MNGPKQTNVAGLHAVIEAKAEIFPGNRPHLTVKMLPYFLFGRAFARLRPSN
jgi:hypothetical protein